MKIKAVRPDRALPGGIVRVELEGIADVEGIQVLTADGECQILGASPDLLTVRISEGGGESLIVRQGSEQVEFSFRTGTVLATELHPVTNPAVDSMGNVYVTYSGTRGEKVPFGVFTVYPDGSKHPFLAEIVNPTGLAIGPDNHLYISSRHTGAIYRSTFDKQVEKFAEGLGLATGIAFNSKGDLYVGDRSGFLYKVSPDGQSSLVCELEPSVSAYHLAVDVKDDIYVTGPTLATQDSIFRISAQGEIETYFKGLGRPQGLAFDAEGRLHVAASYRGRKGLFSLKNGQADMTLSGPMLVGLAYNRSGDVLYLVDNQTLFRI